MNWQTSHHCEWNEQHHICKANASYRIAIYHFILPHRRFYAIIHIKVGDEMKKAKKYIYPLFFSIGFLVSWTALVEIINATSSGEGYGSLGLGMLILFAWLIIALPIYCIRYRKIIVNEKLKFLFSTYNSLLIIALHILPFNLQGETTIIVLFILWVLFWNFVPLISRLISRKYEEKDIRKEIWIYCNENQVFRPVPFRVSVPKIPNA